jgi:peptidoglycan/LPS O-acetylase OafA/YrhL
MVPRTLHGVTTQGSSAGRVVITVASLAVILLALMHIVFGLANFQPGFPKLEGLTSITAGLALLASLILARRSMYRALVTACLGTLPLVAWFGYAVPVEGSSDPVSFWASLVVPTGTGLAAVVLRHRRTATGMNGR